MLVVDKLLPGYMDEEEEGVQICNEAMDSKFSCGKGYGLLCCIVCDPDWVGCAASVAYYHHDARIRIRMGQ